MSKRNSAPTIGWVIMSTINKWVVLISMVILLVVVSGIYVVYSQLEKECSDVFTRDVKVSSYWLHIEAGSSLTGCPQYEP